MSDHYLKFAYDREDKIKVLESELAACKTKIRKLMWYAEHTNHCVLSFYERGEPTEDGRYRIRIKGKWYFAKPVASPVCDCGLDELMDKAALQEKRDAEK